MRPELEALADEHFVSLATFRKSGERVATPVWIARDGDSLIVTTPSDTGKVKRLRNNSAVELRPSSRMGKESGPTVTASAIIEPETPELAAIFARKHPLEYRVFMFIEKRANKTNKPRLILRIR